MPRNIPPSSARDPRTPELTAQPVVIHYAELYDPQHCFTPMRPLLKNFLGVLGASILPGVLSALFFYPQEAKKILPYFAGLAVIIIYMFSTIHPKVDVATDDLHFYVKLLLGVLWASILPMQSMVMLHYPQEFSQPNPLCQESCRL